MSPSPENRADLDAAPYAGFEYPRLTEGRARTTAWEPCVERFRVEEIPAYPFCGEGEHAALRVEKAGLTTRDAATGVARELGLPPAAVGYAGMKDKAAATVQGFSVTGADEQAAARAFEGLGCRVLEATRHRNKLRLGHLAGNRFQVLLPQVEVEPAREALELLQARGIPNYYGPQRFGARGDNARQGERLLRGRQRVARWKRDLLSSALQSFVFNEVLARRLERGQWDLPLAGDVLRREDSGGLFTCEDPAEDGPRAAAFEVSPTGPMPGRKTIQAQAEAALLEAAVLQDLGLAPELFERLRGARRPLRVPLTDGGVELEGDGVRVTFILPAGAFASSVVREIL